VQTGSAWQVEVTVPLTLSVVYSSFGDVVGLKRVSEQIEQLAQRFGAASLQRTAKLARSVYLLARGSADAALDVYRDVLGGDAVRGFTGWARAVGHQAEAFNQLGRHADALRACELALEHVRPEDRRFVRMFLVLELQHALALAGLGRTEDAARQLQSLIAEHEDGQGPLTLGLLHEARARVALTAKDADAFSTHLAAAEGWFRPMRVPSLIARCELLAQEGAEQFEGTRAPSSRPLSQTSGVVTVRSALSECTGAQERADRALELILEESGAPEGHLFVVGADGRISLSASRSSQSPSDELTRAVVLLLESFGEDADPTRHETHAGVPTVELGKPKLDGFRTHLLWSIVGGSPAVVGVAAIRGRYDGRAMAFHFLQAVADGLRGEAVAS
jgi:hypothetical protein